jgi:hypothetical protein
VDAEPFALLLPVVPRGNHSYYSVYADVSSMSLNTLKIALAKQLDSLQALPELHLDKK